MGSGKRTPERELPSPSLGSWELGGLGERSLGKAPYSLLPTHLRSPRELLGRWQLGWGTWGMQTEFPERSFPPALPLTLAQSCLPNRQATLPQGASREGEGEGGGGRGEGGGLGERSSSGGSSPKLLGSKAAYPTKPKPPNFQLPTPSLRSKAPERSLPTAYPPLLLPSRAPPEVCSVGKVGDGRGVSRKRTPTFPPPGSFAPSLRRFRQAFGKLRSSGGTLLRRYALLKYASLNLNL